jgi:hypothetical protein
MQAPVRAAAHAEAVKIHTSLFTCSQAFVSRVVDFAERENNEIPLCTFSKASFSSCY